MTYSLSVVADSTAARLALYTSDARLDLRSILASGTYRLTEPLPGELLDRPWSEFDVDCVLVHELPEGARLYDLEGGVVGEGPGGTPPDPVHQQPPAASTPSSPSLQKQAEESADEAAAHPERITDAEAVRLAYRPHIEEVASLLRHDLPVLVITEKLVVPHLWPDMTNLAERRGILLDESSAPAPAGAGPAGGVPAVQTSPAGPFPGRPGATDDAGDPSANPRQRRLHQLRAQLRTLKEGDVVVLPHLDLLCGGQDVSRHAEARELIELLYEYPDRLVLAFADTSLPLPDVLAERFSVRVSITGLPPHVSASDGVQVLLGRALVTQDEARCFAGFHPVEFYKHVAGMNAVRLRQAMRYARQTHEGKSDATLKDLRQTLLSFKAQQSSHFEIPKVTIDDIGGYPDVKKEIRQALAIVSRAQALPAEMEGVRNELVPRGFIFHGPPGTGKTLFAKAIANEMNATIQVVSGPEVIDMYVGESERKVREVFAAARRSAPSVIVFDEIDAITMQRSARQDGGTRVGNSVVAQILTEMDGFRPEVPLLVIGTTNRIDIIDEALLRPSRFRSIAINLPDLAARRAILRRHAVRYKVDLQDELLELIAEATENRNGDDLRSLMSEACVAQHLDESPLTAHQLGLLVGKLQQERRERKAAQQ
ncbi:ATP-binding protein [Streptomyces sp. NPDC102476]|uniref:ATP-binding protein n=1 Tax=Streptomyces sp. NPDC102476 TaxID=3366181 RepID=UPI003805B702